ncbi:DUF3152 domain-containing protein [Gordonia soli]|uniref:DUF3152 domain-containing protein n=1 Tax=Gordonia soli NBRC 108243 TaxID=1223545 RepID=M0QDC5_9ACTN|nr:DUF3152 domain-containing protein [Gordonia soli]GAC66613.1 hypothetical protein GS4_03_00610 [Gordonia soli NBRC 108243]
MNRPPNGPTGSGPSARSAANDPEPTAGGAATGSRPTAGSAATGSRPTAGSAATGSRPTAGSTRSRPRPDQPLRARWDPTDDSGRQRVDREGQPERKKQSALGRFVSTYGWRAYAIPVLIVLTIVLIIVTVRDGGTNSASAADATPDAASRNTDVSKETAPVGAPTGQIQEAALPAGSLPPGGPYTGKGRESYRVVRGDGRKVGTGPQEYTYTVEVENGLNPQDYGGDPTFAKMVDSTLANPRGWIGDGKVSFRRIDSGEPDLRISLTSPGTTRELCGYQIKLETSCFYPPDRRVTLNEARWVRGALSYQGDDLLYRQYLINHETGHGIGYEAHEPCRENGALAPVMMQQSFGVANSEIMALDPQMKANRALACTPNPWPFPSRR